MTNETLKTVSQGVNADGFSLVIYQSDQSSLITPRVVKDRLYLQADSEDRSDLTDSPRLIQVLTLCICRFVCYS